jgi:hypothetical protein
LIASILSDSADDVIATALPSRTVYRFFGLQRRRHRGEAQGEGEPFFSWHVRLSEDYFFGQTFRYRGSA